MQPGRRQGVETAMMYGCSAVLLSLGDGGGFGLGGGGLELGEDGLDGMEVRG